MYCECGCGETTAIATRNRYNLGHYKGQHIPYIQGHTQRGRQLLTPEELFDEAFGIDTCIIWENSTNGMYGKMYWNNKLDYVHRLVYEVAYGDIPVGLEIDHLCEEMLCYNYKHLEAVSHEENINRKFTRKNHINL